MIRIIDGILVEVPDDERITPEMKVLRSEMQGFLNHISADTPANRELHRQFIQGEIRHNLKDWFKDPDASKK